MAGKTSARVDFDIPNNASWEDGFQFGHYDADADSDDLWSFTDQNFRLDVKGDKDDDTALLTLSTANGRIVVDDVVQRVLHFNCDDATLAAALIPGEYVYDLIMYDNASPPVRVALMHGNVRVHQGVTGN